MFALTDKQVVVVMHGRTSAQPDDTVHLAMDASKVHLFETQNSKRLN